MRNFARQCRVGSANEVGLREVTVEFLRARRERDNGLAVKDPEPLESIDDIWGSATQLATVGIFVLLLGACLYVCRPILMPVLAALVIGMTLAPIVKLAARHGASPWLTALMLGLLLVAAAGTAATLLAQPVSEWIGKAPEIGASIKQKLYVLDRPLTALRELQEVLLPASGNTVAVEPSHWGMVTPVIAFVTPAVAQLTLFFVTLIFFLATQMDFRRYMLSFFTTRDAKLRFIRIANDVEDHLASYVAIVTVINVMLGVIVAAGAWLFGLPNPIIFGILATVLNYIPYIGAACMTVVLFGVGLVTFPSLGHALAPPAAFVALATIEGQFVTPTVLGRRLTLNPLAVLLALAFWAWLWGPMGAFLAVPLTIIGLVTLNHLFPPDESRLPG
jgi:predicted PurR-regulated permease PerM